jgi:hypothetical protein
MAEQRAAEIGFAINMNARASFDVLGKKLGEDNLFREKFGSDGQVRRLTFAAGHEETHK